MMKAKLEVIRINEDVIATSMVHSADYTHYYVSNVNNNCDDHNGKYKIVVKIESNIPSAICYGRSVTTPFALIPGTWYVTDGNGNYEICTDKSHHVSNDMVESYADNNKAVHKNA